MSDLKCDDVSVCDMGYCIEAINHLADAAMACIVQHGECSNAGKTDHCDLCAQALQLTCDAMAKHLECLRATCR
jgi:hypothetical protein